MRILLDISTVAPHRTGVGETVFELAARLPWLLPQGRLLYFFSSFRQPLPRFPLIKDRVERIHWRLPGPLLLSLWLRGMRPHADDLGQGLELYHAPAMFAAPSARIPLILTIHDLFFLDRPDWADGARWGDDYLRRALPARVAEAAMIICPSHRTAEQVRRHFGAEAGGGRVRVIPWGVGARNFLRASAADLRRLTHLGVAPPYLLTVGAGSRRKNIEGLMKAYEIVRMRAPHAPPLVVVGASRGQGHAREDNIVWLPYLPRSVVGMLIRNACVYVCSSWMEGFGLPVLHAMAAGVPVVTTPHVGVLDFTGPGSAAVAESPAAESLAEKIVLVLKDDGIRAQLATRGKQAAAALTWRRSTKETVSAYEEAIGFEKTHRR